MSESKEPPPLGPDGSLLRSDWFMALTSVAIARWSWWKHAVSPPPDAQQHVSLPPRALPWAMLRLYPKTCFVAACCVFPLLLAWSAQWSWVLCGLASVLYTALLALASMAASRGRGVPVLRASWFLSQTPCRFRRHQSLPAEAFVWSSDCRVVLFVSHRWETQAHPDPNNSQAGLMALFLEVNRHTSRDDLRDIGLWYDFSVLPQQPRSMVDAWAFPALLYNFTAVQSLCHTVICGFTADIDDFATRAWCVLETYVGLNKQTLSMASRGQSVGFLGNVRRDWTSAVLDALISLCLMSPDLGQTHRRLWGTVWVCSLCGVPEWDYITDDVHSDAVQAHQDLGCLAGATSLAHGVALIRQAVAHNPAASKSLEPRVAALLLQSWPSRWCMLKDLFDVCTEPVAPATGPPQLIRQPSNGLMSQSERASQLAVQCKVKVRLFETALWKVAVRHVRAGMPAGLVHDREWLHQLAKRMSVECTNDKDTAIVLQAMFHQFARNLHHLVQLQSRLIGRRVDTTHTDGGLFGSSVYHIAACTDSVGLFRALQALAPECGLGRQAPSQAPHLLRDEAGRTPAHMAAFTGAVELLKLMVTECPELLKVRDNKEQTVVLLAAEQGTPTALQALREALGSEQWASLVCEQRDEEDRSALHLAAIANDAESTELLVTHVPQLLEHTDMMEQTALHAAVGAASVDVVPVLLRAHPQPGEYAAMVDENDEMALDLCTDAGIGALLEEAMEDIDDEKSDEYDDGDDGVDDDVHVSGSGTR